MRAYYERLKPNKIQYCSYKKFNEQKFLRDLENTPFHLCNDLIDKNLAYERFKNMFKLVVDKHAPIKSKFIRGTHAPFMNKELRKAIMHRSKLKNLHNRVNTRESWDAFKDSEISVLPLNVKMLEPIFCFLRKTMDTTIKSSGLLLSHFSQIKELKSPMIWLQMMMAKYSLTVRRSQRC